jgi:hypothetical protein
MAVLAEKIPRLGCGEMIARQASQAAEKRFFFEKKNQKTLAVKGFCLIGTWAK